MKNRIIQVSVDFWNIRDSRSISHQRVLARTLRQTTDAARRVLEDYLR
jgi:hypothetical protein